MAMPQKDDIIETIKRRAAEKKAAEGKKEGRGACPRGVSSETEEV